MGTPHSRSDIERYSSKVILIGMGPTCTFADLQPRWSSSRLPVQLECLHFPASASASVSHHSSNHVSVFDFFNEALRRDTFKSVNPP
jgi:hypothetical protein